MSQAVQVRRDFAAPAEEIFAALADPRSSRAWDPRLGEVLELREGPIGLSTTWRETRQGSDGQPLPPVKCMVTAYSPPTHLGLSYHAGGGRSEGPQLLRVQVDYYLTPRGAGGTRVEVSLGLGKQGTQLRGCLSSIVGLLFSHMIKGPAHETVEARLAALEAHLSGQGSGGAPPS